MNFIVIIQKHFPSAYVQNTNVLTVQYSTQPWNHTQDINTTTGINEP